MNDAKVRGIVHLIEETKTYGQKGFRKRLVVLEQSSERFTNYLPLDFIQDACDSVDDLHVGDDVEVSYRLSGRRWQKDSQSEVKFFLSAEATNFQVVKGKGLSGDEASSEKSTSLASANDQLAEAGFQDDDIPF